MFFRQNTTRSPYGRQSPERILERLLPDNLWQSLPNAVRETIMQDSERYRNLPQTAHLARSGRHILWELAHDLVSHADHDLQVAESLAQAALRAEGDVIDECLARTILIQVYARMPDQREQYEQVCLETIDRVADFQAAWRQMQREHHPDLRDEDINVPRLDAFEHLIRFYRDSGDDAAAINVCRQAIAAGYDEYRLRLREITVRGSSGQMAVFVRAILALGTTQTAALLIPALVQETAPTLLPVALTAVLWMVTLALMTDWQLRQVLLAIPRQIRRVPALVWAMILAGVLVWLMQWEILRFDDLRRNYLAWALPWGLSMLLFAGVSRGEWRIMARQLGQSRLTGVMISLTTLLLIVIGLELTLRHVVSFSNSYAIGLNHRRWMQQYWDPDLNELEFRDDAVNRSLPVRTKRVLVVGDSFAAGFGINDIDDTFPHLLGDQLGEDYAIHLVANAGWETPRQILGLRSYPIKPDLVVYSYFLNDIIYMDATWPDHFRQIFSPPPPEIAPLVQNFYLPELLYWNVYRQWLSQGDNRYADLIMDAYRNPVYLERHQADITTLVNWTRDQDAEIIALIWPILTQPVESEPLTRTIELHLRSLDVSVVNMSDYVQDYPLSQRVVNPFDMHPSVALHQEAAEHLYDLLLAENLVDPPAPQATEE